MEQQNLDTFDDGDYTTGPMDGAEEQLGSDDDEGSSFAEVGKEGQSTEGETVQTKEGEEIDEDSQLNLLDEKEETGRKEEEKEDSKGSDKQDEEDKDGDEESESDATSKDDAPEDSREPATDVRTIKGFADGKSYEVPENIEIKTKVAGKWEKPTLQELKDNYSGKQVWDRKITEASEKEAAVNQREEILESEMKVVQEHFGTIRQLTEAGLKGEVDPLSATNYLLDLMGVNTVDYNKAMFNHMADQFDAYSEMTESEREAHWIKKENEYLVKRQESLTNRQSEQQSQAELAQKIHSLREAHSISEEDYVSAENDLKAENQDYSPEQVVQAARLKPLLNQADDLISPYLEQLTDEEAMKLSVEIATTMFKTPQMTSEQVKTFLAEQFEVEEIMTEIEKKVGADVQKNVSSYSRSEELDFFED